MSSFWYNTSLSVKLVILINILIFSLYIFIKLNRKKYIFSIFNTTIFIFVFAAIVMPIFHFNNEAWIAFGLNDAEPFYSSLNTSILINNIGLLIFISSLTYFEFYQSKCNILNIDRIGRKISDRSVLVLYVACILLWIMLVILAGKIPLFGNRMIFDSGKLTILRPVYLAMNLIISILAQFYLFKFIKEKDKFKLALGCIGVTIVLLVGSRSPLIMMVVNFMLICIYFNRSKIKHINSLIVGGLVIALLLGMGMLFIRSGGVGTGDVTKAVKDEILYGNTFSDVRDGAYVLEHYNKKYDTYLYGKNYLADMISFIPSSMSEYRQIYSWGNFSAKVLIGYEGHYGLRGGWFLEPYINFGWIGVIVIAILGGAIFGSTEKIFKRDVFINNDRFEYNFILLNLPIALITALYITSGFHDIYPLIFMIAMLIIPNILKGYEGNK